MKKQTHRIDLEQFKPVPHPFRAIFRRHKVTNAVIANYLDVSLPYVCNLLGGQYKMPAHIETKLEPLVQQLEAEEDK